jgi:hypothetical protein
MEFNSNNIRYKKVLIDQKEVEIFDNIFTAEEKLKLYLFACNSKYSIIRSALDIPESTQYPRTLKCSLNLSDLLSPYFNFFSNKTVLDYVQKNHLRFSDAYINLTTSDDLDSYHTDTFFPSSKTMLYYLNTEWQTNWEGETHFSDSQMQEILFSCSFIPGRLVVLDPTIPHKSSQPSRAAKFHRLVLALKFAGPQDPEYNNSIPIEDCIFKELSENELLQKEVDLINLIYQHTNVVPHSGSTLFNHLYKTFCILKNLNQSSNTCIAGLLHSVYDTEYFSAGLGWSKDYLINLVGADTELLVEIFCSPNRDQIILDNTLKLSTEQYRDILYIAYANSLEQGHRMNVNREWFAYVANLKNKIIELEKYNFHTD